MTAIWSSCWHYFEMRLPWEVVHFDFYGFATYDVLINPSDPVARRLLRTMMERDDFFIFALYSDRSTTAFRSDIEPDNLIWLNVNMARIEASTTTEYLYEEAVTVFAEYPSPPRSHADLGMPEQSGLPRSGG
jgi:hypothetical protein